ncbi:Ig-like domain-containing protein [Kaarinaea lacus]
MVTINKTLKPLASIALTGILLVAVSACGGGGGGGGDPTPGVSSVNPPNGATNVSKTTVVTANFTGSIDAATVDNTTFTLGNSVGDSIAGSVMFDAGMNVATFTPGMDLGVLKTYTGTVSSGVTYSGTTPITQYNWSFTTAEGTWTSADKVDIDTLVAASDPHIARGGNGEAMAVWITTDGFIYGRKYSAGAWGSINQIYFTTYPISDLRVAMDNNGNAMALWTYDGPGAAVDLLGKYYNGTTWDASTSNVGSVNGTIGNTQVAFDATGNAIVVWKQNNDISANRYSSGAWEGDQLIEAGAGVAYTPQLAVFDNGDAIAVWAQAGASYNEIVSNYYTANTGWEVSANPVGNSAAGAVPQVAVDNSGNAFVIWVQGISAPFGLWAAQYDGVSTTWGSLTSLDTDVHNNTVPQIGADSQGNAIALWRAAPTAGVDRLRYKFFDGTAWGTQDNVDDGVADSTEPRLAMDPEGHAVVVWRQNDAMNTASAWQNRYRSGSGWVGPQLLESDETYPVSAQSLDIAIDKNGNAAAVWIQSDDVEMIDSVWAVRFE